MVNIFGGLINMLQEIYENSPKIVSAIIIGFLIAMIGIVAALLFLK